MGFNNFDFQLSLSTDESYSLESFSTKFTRWLLIVRIVLIIAGLEYMCLIVYDFHTFTEKWKRFQPSKAN